MSCFIMLYCIYITVCEWKSTTQQKLYLSFTNSMVNSSITKEAKSDLIVYNV